MKLEIIIASFKSDLKTFVRSKGTLFWTLLFPVMLILIFGAIFSGMDETEIELQVLDLDNTQFSNQLLDVFNDTGVIKVKIAKISSEDEVLSYIQENDLKRFLVIPQGYGDTLIPPVDPNATVNLTFYFDQSEQNSNQIIRNVISNVIQSMNMGFTGGSNIIGLENVETISGEFGFIDFFLPGMIGFTIMQTCIYGSLERNTKFRKDGILRKLLTTPITRSEWIFSKMLFQLFLSFVSAILIIIIGILVFGLNINITFLMIVIVVATSFLFTGMGMVIGRFVKDEESASMAGGAVTFPMMFLAGTFFELEMMPEFLQTFARVLPLYYVNEGLRNAMIYLKTEDAIYHSVIVLIFAVVFFIAGILLTKWKED
jgi:ABC-2 type transport system permease protein